MTMSFRITAAMTTLLGLPFRRSFSAKSRMTGVISDGNKRGHVQRPANGGSPCLDVARALERQPLSSLIGARPRCKPPSS